MQANAEHSGVGVVGGMGTLPEASAPLREDVLTYNLAAEADLYTEEVSAPPGFKPREAIAGMNMLQQGVEKQ